MVHKSAMKTLSIFTEKFPLSFSPNSVGWGWPDGEPKEGGF